MQLEGQATTLKDRGGGDRFVALRGARAGLFKSDRTLRVRFDFGIKRKGWFGEERPLKGFACALEERRGDIKRL
jgi:hypothetical protein